MSPPAANLKSMPLFPLRCLPLPICRALPLLNPPHFACHQQCSPACHHFFSELLDDFLFIREIRVIRLHSLLDSSFVEFVLFVFIRCLTHPSWNSCCSSSSVVRLILLGIRVIRLHPLLDSSFLEFALFVFIRC